MCLSFYFLLPFYIIIGFISLQVFKNLFSNCKNNKDSFKTLEKKGGKHNPYTYNLNCKILSWYFLTRHPHSRTLIFPLAAFKNCSETHGTYKFVTFFFIENHYIRSVFYTA